MKTVIAGLVLGAAFSSANAAVVQVGSVSKTYGTGQGPASIGPGSCDTLNANSVTVRDGGGGCTQRFYDLFDFSSVNYNSLDHLTLTLTFGATNGVNFFVFPEDWRVRFASSTTTGSALTQNMSEVAGTTTQSFDLLSSQDVYAAVAANKKLYLWFAEEGVGANNFELYSAKLDVYGTAVPEPASMALFGIALGALGLSRRRKR